MTSQQQFTVAQTRRHLTTEELAALLGIRAQSIRKRFMETGSYYGVRPVKMPNRFLAWPRDAAEQLMRVGA
jgi:predicted DNA-binding transcriptional regulator AlpA